MTVQQLIDRLKQYPPDCQVFITDVQGEDYQIVSVATIDGHPFLGLDRAVES